VPVGIFFTFRGKRLRLSEPTVAVLSSAPQKNKPLGLPIRRACVGFGAKDPIQDSWVTQQLMPA
jgi:hypothetical protein